MTTIEQNCQDRSAANELAAQVFQLIGDEYKRLPSHRSRFLFLLAVRDRCNEQMQKAPEPIRKEFVEPRVQEIKERVIRMVEDELESDAEDALSLCDTILADAEQVPSAGFEFAESVCEKVRSIRESVERTGRVTPGQSNALENMHGGIVRWIER